MAVSSSSLCAAVRLPRLDLSFGPAASHAGVIAGARDGGNAPGIPGIPSGDIPSGDGPGPTKLSLIHI